MRLKLIKATGELRFLTGLIEFFSTSIFSLLEPV